MRKIGFRKQGSVTLVRIDNEMYQILNFQKHTHLPSITLNVAFCPIYSRNFKNYMLPSCKRLGYFESDLDLWHTAVTVAC